MSESSVNLNNYIDVVIATKENIKRRKVDVFMNGVWPNLTPNFKVDLLSWILSVIAMLYVF